VVTTLVETAPFDAGRAVAFVCGPEIMMRFTARALVDRGVDPDRIRIALERNMQCGVGLCGHCQLGPLLVCRDGPVIPYAGIGGELLRERPR
jgi:NAD(P)H-flavin reductase